MADILMVKVFVVIEVFRGFFFSFSDEMNWNMKRNGFRKIEQSHEFDLVLNKNV